MLVHIVADYGAGDLAFAEVVQRFKLYLPKAEVVLTPVPAFSTLAAGFCVAQLGLNEAPAGTLIYHNIAPRADKDDAREENEGEQFAAGLRNPNRPHPGRAAEPHCLRGRLRQFEDDDSL